MPRFRKKPVVIEAVQVFEQADHYQLADVWLSLDGRVLCEVVPGVKIRTPCTQALGIKTLEGWHIVTPGDWIIKGVKGELYPCKPDIFEATYEAVSSEKD